MPRPYKKRTRGLLIKCECGATIYDDRVGHYFHRKSVLHREYKRIIALLNRPCMTFNVIADRIGVSRERVRQIAGELDVARGYDRMVVCTLTRKQLEWQKYVKTSLLGELIEELNRQGVEWRYAPAVLTLWKKSYLIVSGRLVKLKQAWPSPDGRPYYRATAGDKTAYATVYKMPKGEGWMIVPLKSELKGTLCLLSILICTELDRPQHDMILAQC